MFTDGEIEWVRRTWTIAGDDPDATATLFYDRLFEMAPALRSLFPEDTRAQGRKLIAMIDAAVDHLDRLEKFVPVVDQCGRRHVGYRALPDHYPLVGEALLETLAERLGDRFTPEAKAAWTRTYGVLSSIMLDAQREAEIAA